MPPKNKKGIVKSGNAGNSSKVSKEATDLHKDDGKPPPLFPPGSKYPLSLLRERSDQSPATCEFGQESINVSIGARKMAGKTPQ